MQDQDMVRVVEVPQKGLWVDQDMVRLVEVPQKGLWVDQDKGATCYMY